MRYDWQFAVVVSLSCLLNSASASERLTPQFFANHCVACHGDSAQEGGLRLDTLDFDLSSASTFAMWVKIHDRLEKREMPPKDEPQPTTKERRAVVKGIATELINAQTAQRQSQGRSPLRRLNRNEYENTLRDLFDLPGLDIREFLPEDGRAYGYDKSGDGLELSHVQILKYMEASDFALSVATASQVDPPHVVNERIYPTERSGFKAQLANGEAVLLSNLRLDESILPVSGIAGQGKEKKLATKQIQKQLEAFRGAIGLFRAEGELHPKFNNFDAQYLGFYRVRASCWSFTFDKGEIFPAAKMHSIGFRAGFQGRERILGYYDAPSLSPTIHEFIAWLEPGDTIGFSPATLKHQAPAASHQRAQWTGQGVAVDWLEVEGPLLSSWPPPSHQQLYGDLPLVSFDSDSAQPAPDHSPAVGRPPGSVKAELRKAGAWTIESTQPEADADRLLRHFLPHLFRRPVASDEVQRYVAIVDRMMRENLTFEDSMRWAYKTALCSPEFLMLVEPAGTLSDLALASRLSYFLWNSMPDDTLMALAAKGSLHRSKTLRAQVERMLDNPKAERFVNDFVDQWLDLQEIDMTTPDRKLYPEFSFHLRDSMLGETRSFFRELLDKDMSVLNFVDSDFAMLNQKMAEHYRIEGVEGAEFRAVELPEGCHRGGVMTQASVMKVTANGTTTTPVKHGAWVLREIVGQSPTPPPPNVPAIEPDVNGAVTIREQLDKHRTDQTCAACHAKMDPPGFALESFDVVGGWRDRYRSLGQGDLAVVDGHPRPYLLGPSVDPTGELADGRKFSDIDELKQLLLSDPEQIARNVVEQLLTYATGAEIGFADREAVDDILKRARKDDYGLRSIVHEVVQSQLFREK